MSGRLKRQPHTAQNFSRVNMVVKKGDFFDHYLSTMKWDLKEREKGNERILYIFAH